MNQAAYESLTVKTVWALAKKKRLKIAFILYDLPEEQQLMIH